MRSRPRQPGQNELWTAADTRFGTSRTTHDSERAGPGRKVSSCFSLAECPDLDYVLIRKKAMQMLQNRALHREVDAAPQRLDASRFAPANRKRLSAPALRTFLAIADLWGLSEEQRLLVLG